MKITLNIDDTIMRALREEAARRGTTMSALVDAGLRRILFVDPSTETPSDPLPPLPTWRGGEMLVDVSNRDELYRAIGEPTRRDRR